MKKKEDNIEQLPKYTTTMKSRYNLDYQPRMAENIDFKELDSYHDKLKFLEVSYFPSKQDFFENAVIRKELL